MKPKKIKARKMYSDGGVCFSSHKHDRCTPFFVLPADAASVEAMVEQMAEAMWDHGGSVNDLARAALSAIGIKTS